MLPDGLVTEIVKAFAVILRTVALPDVMFSDPTAAGFALVMFHVPVTFTDPPLIVAVPPSLITFESRPKLAMAGGVFRNTMTLPLAIGCGLANAISNISCPLTIALIDVPMTQLVARKVR